MNVRVVTPDEFKAAFLEIVSAHEDALVARWSRFGEYTKYFMGPKTGCGLIHKIARRLVLECHKEYWHIDAIFCKCLDKTHFRNPNATYAKSVAVAFEHENNSDSSNEEMNKLSIIDAPLKVLVTYYRSDQCRDKHLEEYAEILGEADGFSDFSTSRKHMVVFGHREHDRALWSFYVYAKGKFDVLP